MHKHIDAEKFLQAIFGPDNYGCCVLANLNPAKHVRSLEELDQTRDCYWSIAAFPPGVKITNHEDNALHTVALVIDDVGTKGPSAAAVALALGRPTAIVESSLNNFQWVYRLAKPVAIADWPGFLAGVEELIQHPAALEARGAQTLMRLPMGVNSKKGKKRFAVRLVALTCEIELDPDTIPRTMKSVPRAASGPSQRVHDIKRLVVLVPNNVDYDGWIAVGQRIKALALDEEDGREAWHEFSARSDQNNLKKDTEATWHTLTADRTRGGLLLAAAEAADPEAFAQWEAKEAFNDGDQGSASQEAPPLAEPPRGGITATPYKWVDLDRTTPRDWLYGDILLRKFISMTVAPGGVGKSSLITVETLAQVTGKSLLDEDPAGELRVWLWNLEDPYAETQLRIQAAAKHYGITEADIGDRLFVDSGRDQRLVIAKMDRNGATIVHPVVASLVKQIKLRQIDVVVIDPFVSCHEAPENDNTAQDMIVKEWGRVAELGGCAVHLVDHTSKAGSQEVVTDSARGAKAKTDAARVVRVVNRMSASDGKAYGITETWRYFNTFNDKANMAPPKARRAWFTMKSIWANNGGGAAAAFSVGAAAVPVQGDSVGVAVKWVPPNAQALANGDSWQAMVAAMGDKQWRKDVQAKEKWIGIPAATACGLLRHSPIERQSVKEVIKKWIDAGLLKEVAHEDEHRKTRTFIEIAQTF